jgi:hypothetical protein
MAGQSEAKADGKTKSRGGRKESEKKNPRK